MKITITQISRKERTSKAGKPYTSLGLKTQEHGEKWLSGFDGKMTKDWKIGDVVDVDVEQNGEYMNFSVPKLPAGYAMKPEIEAQLFRIDTNVQAILRMMTADLPKDNYPVMDETNNGEIPY